MGASSRLEHSYRELQAEVAQLNGELSERNVALEKSLAENQRVHQALAEVVDSMPCGVLVLRSDGTVLRINEEARRLLGLNDSASTHLGAIADRTGVDLQPFCAGAGSHEFLFARGGTARCWVELRTRPIAAVDGKPATILTLRDVTAHKEAEEERERGRQAFALASMAATLAHEVRNPLASMELFAGLLAEEPTRAAEWTMHLRAGLRTLAATVNNVLSYRGARFAHLRPLALGQVIRGAAEFVRPLTEQAGITLVLEEGRDCEGTVLANQSALEQVVLNLVLNAVRHTERGGRITIALGPAAEGKLVFTVRDTGCGIAAEHLAKIFDVGWSGSGANSGLGLAVCREIARDHGAELRVESVPGRGSAFRMEVPSL